MHTAAPKVGSAAREAIFAQLADAGRAEQVARRLTDAIILGVLEPGERLPSEPELARRFGVALITVREGLGMLRAAHLVETRRGRDGGSFVVEGDRPDQVEARLAGISRIDLADQAVWFATVLQGAAERAAERATDTEAERLASWLEAADLSTGPAARTNLGGFFLEIAVLSQSARLVRAQIRAQADTGPLLLAVLDDDDRRREAADAARALAAAIRAHDPAAARRLVADEVEALAAALAAEKNRLDRAGAR